MRKLSAQVLVLLFVRLAVTNAQCFAACSLTSCAKAALPVPADTAPSCHQHKTPKNMPAGHRHDESCAHELLRSSASEGAQAPIQVVLPVSLSEPLAVYSFGWNSLRAQPPSDPSPPLNTGIVSITILRI